MRVLIFKCTRPVYFNLMLFCGAAFKGLECVGKGSVEGLSPPYAGGRGSPREGGGEELPVCPSCADPREGASQVSPAALLAPNNPRGDHCQQIVLMRLGEVGTPAQTEQRRGRGGEGSWPQAGAFPKPIPCCGRLSKNKYLSQSGRGRKCASCPRLPLVGFAQGA